MKNCRANQLWWSLPAGSVLSKWEQKDVVFKTDLLGHLADSCIKNQMPNINKNEGLYFKVSVRENHTFVVYLGLQLNY